WGAEWPETLNTLTLSEEDGRTTVVSTVLYPSKEARDAAMATGMEDGWAVSNDRLEEYLRTLA
ncbi:MAG: SRPBCC domain-containing protein, partial [Longimicrobiales bacterium]